MKKLIILLSISVFFLSFSQNRETRFKETNSKVFKGSIDGAPITMFLKEGDIIEANLYNRYISGWYYYDKYKKKILLNGYSGPHVCDMKLFSFGGEHTRKMKIIDKGYYIDEYDKAYENSSHSEKMVFDRCFYGEDNEKYRKGIFNLKGEEKEIVLYTDDIYITNFHEYYRLPNGKNIDLIELFGGYGYGKTHTFVSMKEDKHENRILFSYRGMSNYDAMGHCGADEDEKYHIVYFDKKWNVKKTEVYPLFECRSNTIAEEVSDNKFFLREEGYYFLVDKRNASIYKEYK